MSRQVVNKHVDRQSYLKQIAVEEEKPRDKKTMQIIKFGLIGLVAIVGIVVTMILLSLPARTTREMTESLAVRIGHASSPDGYLAVYGRQVRSLELRGKSEALRVILRDTSNRLDAMLPSVGIDPQDIPLRTFTPERRHHDAIMVELENARLNARLPAAFIRVVVYELTEIIAMQQNVIERTSSAEIRNLLTDSVRNLTAVRTSWIDAERGI